MIRVALIALLENPILLEVLTVQLVKTVKQDSSAAPESLVKTVQQESQ
jgi:hypothetical protein